MQTWEIVMICGIIGGIVLLIGIMSIFTSWKFLEKRVRKYVARGDSIFTIRVQGFFVQQKKYKLIDLCEQNGYIMVEESQEMSTSSNSSRSGRRSYRGTSSTQVTARVLTFKKK